MLSSRGLSRREQPYPTDTTDEQWALIAPFVASLSESGPGTKGGRPPDYDRREIIDGILYITRAGCAWRLLPHDFPPYRLVFYYFRRWSADGRLDRIHQALRDAVRDATARDHGGPDGDPDGGGHGPVDTRDPMASAAVVDSQSIAAAPTVGHLVDPGRSSRNSPDGPGDARGYDAGKKINGRKQHLVVDTLGLLIAVLVTPASVQDRDGGIRVLSRAKTVMPSLVLVWADAAYSKKVRDFAATCLRIAVEVVARPAEQRGFAVLPRRWVAERTHAWFTACRCLARDYERRHTHAEAMIKLSSIGLMLRRLAPTPGPQPWSQSVAA